MLNTLILKKCTIYCFNLDAKPGSRLRGHWTFLLREPRDQRPEEPVDARSASWGIPRVSVAPSWCRGLGLHQRKPGGWVQVPRRVHRYPGTAAAHRSRLLEDAVGVQLHHRGHAHQAQGNGAGKKWATSARVCDILILSIFYRKNVISIGQENVQYVT